MNEFSKVVDSLILLNKQNRILNEETIKHIGDIAFAIEFGTVHVNCGRRTGKTEYIKSRATKDDLVIVFNPQVKNDLFKECDGDLICPFDFPKYKRGFISKYNFVYIDEPKLVNKRIALDEIYSALANKETTFVLLGE